mgnify:CR=1 FL=1
MKRIETKRIGVVGLGAMGSLFFQRISINSPRSIEIFPISRTKTKRIPILSEQLSQFNPKLNTNISLYQPHELTEQLSQSNPKLNTNISVYQPHELTELDIAVILTKAFNISDLAKSISWDRFLSKNGLVVVLSNGYGHDLTLNQYLSKSNRRAIQGTTSIPSTIRNNLIYSSLEGDTYLPLEQLNQEQIDHLLFLNNLFNRASLKSQIVQSSKDIILRKVAVNAVINGLTSIWRITNGKLLETPYLGLFDEFIDEITTIVEDDIEKQELLKQSIVKVARQTKDNTSSMLADIIGQRRTEVDYIFPILLQMGETKGIPCQYLKIIYRLIIGIENTYRSI